MRQINLSKKKMVSLKMISVFSFSLLCMQSCGSEESISEAISALNELEAIDPQALEESDAQALIESGLESELTGSNGNQVKFGASEFNLVAEESEKEIASKEALTDEVEKDNPAQIFLIKETLDTAVEYIFTTADSDDDGFLDFSEWTETPLVSEQVKLPEMREDLFVAANQKCPKKDEDVETLSSDEVRCILRRVAVGRLKPHFEQFPKEARIEKRNEMRTARAEKFKEKKVGTKAPLNDTQKEELKAQLKTDQKEREKKGTKFEDLNKQKKDNPEEFKKKQDALSEQRQNRKKDLKDPPKPSKE